MDIDKAKQEEFVRASEKRIYDFGKTVGLEHIDPVVKTAILSELRTMYETGFRHCDESWDEYMEDMRIERDLSERD